MNDEGMSSYMENNDEEEQNQINRSYLTIVIANAIFRRLWGWIFIPNFAPRNQTQVEVRGSARKFVCQRAHKSGSPHEQLTSPSI